MTESAWSSAEQNQFEIHSQTFTLLRFRTQNCNLAGPRKCVVLADKESTPEYKRAASQVSKYSTGVAHLFVLARYCIQPYTTWPD